MSLLLIFAHVQGRLLTYFFVKKTPTFNVAFFSDTIKARFVKLCMIVSLLGQGLHFHYRFEDPDFVSEI